MSHYAGMETIPDLGQRFQLLIEACHSLAARPDDVDLQQRVLQTLVACDVNYPQSASPLVRGLSNLVRGYASILRRQLEAPRADPYLIGRAAIDVCHHMTDLADALGDRSGS